ncbi:MAG: hypothetical protein AAFR11_14950 [Pseudomonadota bacterium]
MFKRKTERAQAAIRHAKNVSVLRLRARLAAAKTPGEAVRLRHELDQTLQPGA